MLLGSRLSRRVLALAVCWLVGGSVAGPSMARRARIPAEVRFEDRYAQALGAFAEGRDEEAVTRLEALHREVVERTPRDPVLALEKKTLAISGKLARAEPDAALAIAALHGRTYSAHLERSEYLLASFSRGAAESILRDTSLAENPGRRARVAAQLTSLAGRVHDARQWSAASDLYRSAVALDPTLAPAWLGLAAIQEKRGGYRSAVESLGAMARLDNPPIEGMLRLGVNLVRVGRPLEASRLLGELTQDEWAPAWIRSIAAQELARDFLRSERGEEALAVLERAAADLPCDTPLRVLLDYVRAREGVSVDRGPFVLDGFCPGEDASSRVRYNRPPALDKALAESEEPSQAARRALADALRRRGYGP